MYSTLYSKRASDDQKVRYYKLGLEYFQVEDLQITKEGQGDLRLIIPTWTWCINLSYWPAHEPAQVD